MSEKDYHQLREERGRRDRENGNPPAQVDEDYLRGWRTAEEKADLAREFDALRPVIIMLGGDPGDVGCVRPENQYVEGLKWIKNKLAKLSIAGYLVSGEYGGHKHYCPSFRLERKLAEIEKEHLEAGGWDETKIETLYRWDGVNLEPVNDDTLGK